MAYAHLFRVFERAFAFYPKDRAGGCDEGHETLTKLFESNTVTSNSITFEGAVYAYHNKRSSNDPAAYS